jgi:membrane-bound ClpP family serine protease
MPLITLVITLIVVGVLLYLLEVYVPMDGTIKRIIHIVVIIAVVLWLLNVFGILPMAANVQVPRVH